MSNGRPRSSIFGAALFIAVGALLLLALNTDMRILPLIGRYWPVLLILLGLSKLFDYFVASRTGEARPRGLSGGEVFLIILLILTGLCVTGFQELVRNNPGIWEEFEGMGTPYTSTEEVAQAVKPGSQLSINMDRGSITIRPEQTDQLRVVVKKTAWSFDAAEAEQRSREVKVAIQEIPGGYEIVPKVSSSNQRSVRVDLEVHVPKKLTLKAKTERGDVQITGLEGSVTVVNRRGDVELRGITGDAEVELRSGDVRATDIKGTFRLTGRGSEIEVADVTGEAYVQGEFYGPIRLKNVTKQVHFLSQRSDITISQLPGRLEMGGGDTEVFDTPGNVSLATSDRDVVLENVGGRIQVKNRRGDISVRLREAPKEPIEIVNESAGVTLSLPGKASFEFSGSSRQGDVQSDFEGLSRRSDDRNAVLEGTIGARGPKIQIRTTYGSVNLRKIN